MATTTLQGLIDTAERPELMFYPDRGAFYFQPIESEFFTDWTDGSGKVTPPTDLFPAGLISDSTGFTISEETKMYEPTSQWNKGSRKSFVQEFNSKATMEIQELPTRGFLSEMLGVQIPENLPASGVLKISRTQSPSRKGLRGTMIELMATPYGDIEHIICIPRMTVSGAPGFERKGNAVTSTKIDFDIALDADSGEYMVEIWGGEGWKHYAEKLGYKITAA